jgi:hypothetical protein
MQQKQFTYLKDNRKKKLVFHLPAGRVNENFRIGEDDGKEQFYYFGDGSVLYIARHATWQTINEHRIDPLKLNEKKQATTFSGKDERGLYWKEIHIEEFRMGYGYVTADKAEQFDKALNAVKIR